MIKIFDIKQNFNFLKKKIVIKKAIKNLFKIFKTGNILLYCFLFEVVSELFPGKKRE